MNSLRAFTFRNVLLTVVIVIADLAIYVVLGLSLMDYEDFYEEGKGPYWSLGSMTLWQKVAYIGWHLWVRANLFCLGYLIYRAIKRVGGGNSAGNERPTMTGKTGLGKYVVPTTPPPRRSPKISKGKNRRFWQSIYLWPLTTNSQKREIPDV